jgi:hypothetical protein
MSEILKGENQLRKVSSFIVLGLAIVLSARASFAVGITQAITNNPGPLKMKLTLVSTGTAYAMTGVPSGGGVEDGFATPAAAATAVDARGVTSAVKGAELPGEDTWGIFEITQLLTDVGHPLGNNVVLWNKGQNDEELTGIFYGGRDVFVSGSALEIDTALETLEFYLEVIPGLSGSPALAEFGPASLLGTAGRTAPAIGFPGGTFPGITDGTLWMRALSGNGVHSEDGILGNNGGANAHRHDTLTGPTAPFTGDGFGFVDGVPGTGAGANLIAGTLGRSTFIPGLFRDIQIEFNLNAVDIPPGTDWDTAGEDPVRFLTRAPQAVPEPGTVVLVGLGLLGLAVGVRKRRAK